jgi:hypothetical protein
MIREEWERRRRKRKEFARALLWAPIILLATFGFVYGYLELLSYCGLL